MSTHTSMHWKNRTVCSLRHISQQQKWYFCVPGHASTYMCIDMCIDMCTDMCMDMCIDMCIDMCTDMCMDMCIDMCVDMCIDMVQTYV